MHLDQQTFTSSGHGGPRIARVALGGFITLAVLLVAAPAHASDMCPLGLVIFGPVYIGIAAVTATCAGLMRRRETLGTAALLLGVLGVAAMAHIWVWCIRSGAFHDSMSLRHPEMLYAGLLAIAVIGGANALLWYRLARSPEA